MDIDLLKGCGTTVTFHEGQAICREGESGQSMFVLLRGKVNVIINSFSDNSQVVDTLQEGSFFGEMSLLEGKPRSATVIASTADVIVLEVSQTDFSMLLLNATSITYRLLLSLNNRLNGMLDRIEEKTSVSSLNTAKIQSTLPYRKWMSALLMPLQKRIRTMYGHCSNI